MYLWVLTALMVGLSIVGLATLIEWLVLFFSEPKKIYEGYYVLPVKGDCEDLEQVLRWGYENLRRDRLLVRGKLVLLDVGAREAAAELCLRFCEENSEVLFLNRAQFDRLIVRGK